MKLHSVIVAVARIIAAFRHVRSGGKSTRTRAVQRANAPPRACPTCKQPIYGSTDWRDHYQLEHTEDPNPRP